MFLDLSMEHLVWDHTSSLVYTSRRLNGGDQQLRVSIAKRRAVNRKELAASNGVYTATDQVFLIPTAEILPLLQQGREPQPGDRVTPDPDPAGAGTNEAAGTVDYVVLPEGVAGQRRDKNGPQCWKITARNLVLAFELYDLIDIQRPALQYDAAGAVVRKWPDTDGAGQVVYGQLPARVQLLTQEETEERELRGFRSTYAVIVSKQLALGSEDRVRWVPRGQTTPVYLQILGQHNPQRIDELPVLDCVLPP